MALRGDPRILLVFSILACNTKINNFFAPHSSSKRRGLYNYIIIYINKLKGGGKKKEGKEKRKGERSLLFTREGDKLITHYYTGNEGTVPVPGVLYEWGLPGNKEKLQYTQ